MAEIILSSFFTVLFEKLASESLKTLARSKGIDSKIKKLKRYLIQIRALLNDASQKEVTDETVKEWLNDLQHLAYDIDDLFDDLETEAVHHELAEESGASTSKVRRLIPSCCTSFSLSTRMHEKLDNLTNKLQELVEEKDNLGLSVKGESPKYINRRLQTSLVDPCRVVGREADKDALLRMLLRDEPCDKNFSIVPIVGMGGVGKTTLARLLYNEMQGKDHFELMAWVCASDEFDIFNISKTIFHSITAGNQEFKDLNLLQVALKEKISNKRFLLVLDDVWSESYADWEILERPFLAGSQGSKIIMTTRKQSLLTQLGYNQPYDLSGLSPYNAKSLFCQHALGENNFDAHPTLKRHGEGIVDKCDGLPLALVALGRLLRTKTDEEEWNELLNSEIWTLGKKDEIVPALRLSYHDLSASLKQVFAYCSLFPKGYVFDKEVLILLWMAEGFLYQSTTSKPMERLGLEYFDELLSKSFFQHAPGRKSLFVMHDILNDLATSVAGNFFSRVDIKVKKDFNKRASEKYRHMSFLCEDFLVYTRCEASKRAKNLRTFLALSLNESMTWHLFHLSNKILADLLHELPLLRVLCLSKLMISEVPNSIGNLKHLRYLNLSRTTIRHLPSSVCNLHNLQTLIVSRCQNLTELPNNFVKLKNLRHLDIRSTPILKMPTGIGELKSLRTLSNIIIEGENGFSITELKDLTDLQGEISFKGLENVQSPMHAHVANLSQKRVSWLELEWSNTFDGFRKEKLEKDVLNALKPHNDNLVELHIVSYGGIEFPNWIGDPSFLRLTHVWIYGCQKCTSLPPLGQLPSLKKLFIQSMNELKVVGSELLGPGLAFPSLVLLSFLDMQGLEVWSTNSGEVDVVFPYLQELRITGCPNLEKVSLEALPSLRVLKVCRCSHNLLKSLVHVASWATRLELSSIAGLDNQMWGGVVDYLGAVEELYISSCNEIRYLWESEEKASKVLVNIRLLAVAHCSNLVSLGENEVENSGSNLTSLRSLSIWDCKNLEHCRCPDSIESLSIDGCDIVTFISFPNRGGQKLKSLRIESCKKLLGEEFEGHAGVLKHSSIQVLESLYMNSLPNLKSIVEVSLFIQLTKLEIRECPNMESFPDHELPNLTFLKHLTIENCQSVDASFPSGLWPPKLCFLRIGALKKRISDWGPQNFPSSLVELELIGGGLEDVSDFSQLPHIFPSSLTSLDINEFEKLESVSMGLQHLTSLQHLSLRKCPKAIDLPEVLLASLMNLIIIDCPNLKERSRGSYGRLMSHIRKVYID